MKKSLTALAASFLLAGFSLNAHDDNEVHNHNDSSPNPTAPVKTAVQTGQGDFKYTTVPGWGKIPGEEHIGSTHGGIVIDKAGNVYCSTDGKHGVIVYTEEGKFIKSLGKHTKRFHGMNLYEEGGKEYIYAASGAKVFKLDLEGEVVLTIEGKDQKWRKATAVAVDPKGNIFIADGYGSSIIFKYDSTGKFIKKFSSKGSEDGQLKTSHGLAIDNRNPEKPLLIVCDRANKRIQLFDLEGNFVKVAVTDLRLPCAVSVWKEYILVAELQGRAVILDKDYKIISKLGDNPNEKQWAKFGINPKDWQGGIFTAPHGCAFDAKGNVYIQNWNKWGRITKLVRDK